MNPSVRRARVLGAAGACVMIALLAYALLYGDLGEEGGRLISMPWGLTTVVDVYVGLALFSGWVLWRESSRAAAAAWIALFLATGNLGTCCYVLRAALSSGGATVKFWTGGNSEN